MKIYFNIVALFIISSCFAQIKLEVTEVPYDSLFLSERTRDDLKHHTKHKGHILEVTVRNLSDLPLDVIPDTKGFAFPIIDNLQKDYIGNNVLRHVDEMDNAVTYSTFER